MSAPLPCLTIAGPTASGKSDLAIEIAEQIHGEIIGADAFQIYEGIPILTAQVPKNDRREIPHHLVGEINPATEHDVASYLKLARDKIAAVRAAGRIPILVGGTGFYIRAVLQGLSEGLPAANPALRARLETEELDQLVSKLIQMDPAAEKAIDLRNPRRVIRALEVCLLTGRPFTSFRASEKTPIQHVGIWIARPRMELNERIALRTEQILRQGAIEEVDSLDGRVGKTAIQAIGFREIEDHLKGNMSRDDLTDRIKKKTRDYAKRQETWFRREPCLLATSMTMAKSVALEIAEDLLKTGR
jgi:tRNA dimethylallyltransferase